MSLAMSVLRVPQTRLPRFPSDDAGVMRKLTSKQLQRLRGIAAASLELSKPDRPDLGIAPEDLIVACDVALGHDALEDYRPNAMAALNKTGSGSRTTATT